MNRGLPNKITSANAGKRFGFAGKSRVGLSPRPGATEFHRSLRHLGMSTHQHHVKIVLTDDEGRIETPWAVHLGGSHYRLDNIPALARGVSWQDVVEAQPGADGFPEFVRVIEKSGYRTIRALLECPPSEPESSWRFLDELVGMGCRYEALAPHAFVLSIPPALDLKIVQDYLDETGHQWEQTDPPDEDSDDKPAP